MCCNTNLKCDSKEPKSKFEINFKLMQLLISLGSLVCSELCIVQFSDEANNALQGGDLCSIFYTKKASCVLYSTTSLQYIHQY